MDLERKDITNIIRGFSPDQMERYECYRRSNISKPSLKKLFQSVSGGVVLNPNGLIILCSVIKMYIGEMVETSRQAMEDNDEGDLDEIRVRHILKAIEKLERQNRLLRKKKITSFQTWLSITDMINNYKANSQR